jgi:hypothetical protein
MQGNAGKGGRASRDGIMIESSSQRRAARDDTRVANTRVASVNTTVASARRNHCANTTVGSVHKNTRSSGTVVRETNQNSQSPNPLVPFLTNTGLGVQTVFAALTPCNEGNCTEVLLPKNDLAPAKLEADIAEKRAEQQRKRQERERHELQCDKKDLVETLKDGERRMQKTLGGSEHESEHHKNTPHEETVAPQMAAPQMAEAPAPESTGKCVEISNLPPPLVVDVSSQDFQVHYLTMETFQTACVLTSRLPHRRGPTTGAAATNSVCTNSASASSATASKPTTVKNSSTTNPATINVDNVTAGLATGTGQLGGEGNASATGSSAGSGCASNRKFLRCLATSVLANTANKPNASHTMSTGTRVVLNCDFTLLSEEEVRRIGFVDDDSVKAKGGDSAVVDRSVIDDLHSEVVVRFVEHGE